MWWIVDDSAIGFICNAFHIPVVTHDHWFVTRVYIHRDDVSRGVLPESPGVVGGIEDWLGWN